DLRPDRVSRKLRRRRHAPATRRGRAGERLGEGRSPTPWCVRLGKTAHMKTSLGIWAFGPMVTRFVPRGYQPEHACESTTQRVSRAVAGLGDLIDDYEFHCPQELSEENLEDV